MFQYFLHNERRRNSARLPQVLGLSELIVTWFLSFLSGDIVKLFPCFFFLFALRAVKFLSCTDNLALNSSFTSWPVTQTSKQGQGKATYVWEGIRKRSGGGNEDTGGWEWLRIVLGWVTGARVSLHKLRECTVRLARLVLCPCDFSVRGWKGKEWRKRGWSVNGE